MRKFYVHPDRLDQAVKCAEYGNALPVGTEIVVDKYMPLFNSEGKSLLGWWIDDELFNQMLGTPPTLPLPHPTAVFAPL